MKILVAALAGVLMLMGTGQAAEWGTIAYSPGSGATGFSYNWPNEVDVEITALDGCARSDCVSAVNFHDGCGALAVGRSGGWGADWGADRATAEWGAIAQCEDYDSNCRIRRWQCSY